MRASVVVPPDPILTPADIAGDHAADDAGVAAIIQAVTEEIDGPTGWLGRAIGPQTIELLLSGFCFGRNLALPCPPVIGPVEISYLDADEVEQTVDAGSYRIIDNRIWFRPEFSFPTTFAAPDAVRISYVAGYNGDAVATGGTGDIPERIRQFIILTAQHLKSIETENLFLRSVEIPDVETRQYVVSEKAGEIIRDRASRLLDGLRIYS